MTGRQRSCDVGAERRRAIAQMNVGRLREPVESPATAGFMDALDPVNALADAAPGFLWRLQTESGNATEVRIFDDPLMIVNLSLWESIDALRAFAFSGPHLAVLRQRREWFTRWDGPSSVLWWHEADVMPTPEEGLQRLALLASLGPTTEAFDFARSL